MIYGVKFEMMIFHNPNADTAQSLIHLTNGENNNNPGNRIPAVWVNSDHQFTVRSYVNGDKNYKYQYNSANDLSKKWIPITISQTLKNSKYVYEIGINNTTVHSVNNIQPSGFNEVMAYATNPWEIPVTGFVKGLSIVTGKNK